MTAFVEFATLGIESEVERFGTFIEAEIQLIDSIAGFDDPPCCSGMVIFRRLCSGGAL